MVLTRSKTGAIQKERKDLEEEQPPRRGDQTKRIETSTSEGEPLLKEEAALKR